MPKWNNKIKIEIFGASHDKEIGAIIKDLPSGVKIDIDSVLEQMKRRAPGQVKRTTRRKEDDIPVIKSGLTEDNVTNGEPLKIIIENQNANTERYESLKYIPRPGHADYAAYLKYGIEYDMSGGSVFSGRMTAPLVFAGEICRQILSSKGIKIVAHISEIFGIKDTSIEKATLTPELIDELRHAVFPVINQDIIKDMSKALDAAMMELDSVGGAVECALFGVKPGYGGPMFDGLESKFAQALFAIPGVKGVEFGSGFKGTRLRGSQNNDQYFISGGNVITNTNNSGGILGGISTGMPIVFNVAFKPTSSIGMKQHSVNLKTKEEVTINIKGKHDPCIAPRAVPVVEAVAAIVMLNIILSEEENG